MGDELTRVARKKHGSSTTEGTPVAEVAASSAAPVAGLVAPVRRRVTVGAADDVHEVEADAVAERVVGALRTHADQPSEQGGGSVSSSPAVVGAAGGDLDDGTAASLAQSRGGGTGLPTDVRRTMESAMGADLGGVRIHVGSAARELSERMSAEAFTVGNDVFFRDGMPSLGSESGQHLLAHELAHTQQPDQKVSRWLLGKKKKAPARPSASPGPILGAQRPPAAAPAPAWKAAAPTGRPRSNAVIGSARTAPAAPVHDNVDDAKTGAYQYDNDDMMGSGGPGYSLTPADVGGGSAYSLTPDLSPPVYNNVEDGKDDAGPYDNLPETAPAAPTGRPRSNAISGPSPVAAEPVVYNNLEDDKDDGSEPVYNNVDDAKSGAYQYNNDDMMGGGGRGYSLTPSDVGGGSAYSLTPSHVGEDDVPVYQNYEDLKTGGGPYDDDAGYAHYNNVGGPGTYNNGPQYTLYSNAGSPGPDGVGDPQYAHYNNGPQYTPYNNDPQYTQYNNVGADVKDDGSHYAHYNNVGPAGPSPSGPAPAVDTVYSDPAVEQKANEIDVEDRTDDALVRVGEALNPGRDPAQAPATASEPKQRRQLAKLNEHYENERTDQRADLLGAIESVASFVRLLHQGLQLLAGIRPDDATGLQRVKNLFMGKAYAALYRILTPMGHAETLKALKQRYDDKLELAKRQDIPMGPDGSLGDMSSRLVTYDESPEAQAKTEVTIRGGQLYRSDGAVVDTKDSSTFHSGNGVEIFVVGPRGDLHMASHKIGKYHHSSLLAGGDVSMGGELKVNGGTIEWMSNKSGHYTPSTEHFVQFLHYLEKDHLPMDFAVRGWGVPEGKTARQYLDGLTTEESYDYTKTQAVWQAFCAQFGEDKVKEVVRAQGWKVKKDGGQVTAADGSPVPLKSLRKLLKEAFGTRGKSKVKRGGDDAISFA